jgi:hypothetical protein
MLDRIVSELDITADKGLFECTLNSLDQQISEEVAALHYRHSPVSQELYLNHTQAHPLAIPKSNSLTDNYLRTTLGCEETYPPSHSASPSPTYKSSTAPTAAGRKNGNNGRKWQSGSSQRALAIAIWQRMVNPSWEGCDWPYSDQ